MIARHQSLLIVLGLIAVGCSPQFTKGWTDTDWRLAAMGISPIDRAKSDEQSRLWRVYVYDVLYVGMPEEEFVRLFTRSGSAFDHPYIVAQSDHQYVFLEYPSQEHDKARVTFQGGRLIKYERYGLGTNPWGYSNATALLRTAPSTLTR